MKQEISDIEKRITPFYLSKYEKARLISTRAIQISMDSECFLRDTTNIYNMDPIEIATREFEEGSIPLGIQRRLPNGRLENITIKK